MIEITHQFAIPEAELSWSFVRSGGPGGQNVNKVASKAVLRWDLDGSRSVPEEVKARLRAQQRGRVTTDGEVVLSSQRHRDQERNRHDCLDKFVEMLRAATVAPKKRKKKKPTRASKERRLREKRHRSAAKSSRRKPAAE
jgi:ribosome-associated protein